MKQFVISIRVLNKFGVLSRVASMFSRRGFNIDSLTVSETESEGISRITITATGDEYTRKQIILQLNRLHEVISITRFFLYTGYRRIFKARYLCQLNDKVRNYRNVPHRRSCPRARFYLPS